MNFNDSLLFKSPKGNVKGPVKKNNGTNTKIKISVDLAFS
jgi:hypothetical protein